jgi:hypothetical protein
MTTDSPDPGAAQQPPATGSYLPEHPLDRALRHLGPEANSRQRLEIVWRAYEEATGRCIGRPPAAADRQDVLRWLRVPDATDNRPGLWAQRPLLTPILHPTIPDKASSLTQLGCRVCTPDELAGPPLAITFPIGIQPWSAQSESDRVAIRQAVTDALRKRGAVAEPWRNSPVCVSIAAVVPRAGKRKDVDNLVKGLLDAMQGYLYPDDELVQCLTVRRLEYAGTEGYYLVHALPVAAWTHDIVVDAPASPVLLSGHVIRPAGASRNASRRPSASAAVLLSRNRNAAGTEV